MTWVKIDDQMPEDRKFIGVSAKARLLWIDALCYCSRQLTDGEIPREQLPSLVKGKTPLKYAQELVTAGLWEDKGDVFLVHNYLQYNPTSAAVLEKRRSRQEAGRRGGLASASQKSQAKDEALLEDCFNPRPVPSRPLPNSTSLPSKNEPPKTDNSQSFDMDEDPFADRVIPLRSAEGKKVFDEMMAEIMHKADEDVQGYRHDPDREIEKAQFVSLEGKVLTVYMNTTYHDPDYYEGLIGRRATRTRCWGGYQFRVLMPEKVATA